MSEAEDLAAVASLIADGEAGEGFARLRSQLGWPRGKQVGDLAAWLGVLGELALMRGAGPLSELAIAAARAPDSPERLYDLGYALIDAGSPAIAASVLWRCLVLVGESEEVLCELVSALESALAYQDAFAILEQHAALRDSSFLCEYLYAFNAAMTGRLDITRAALARLAPDSPETETMRGTIVSMIDRADRLAGSCPLDARDLRGWQYVLTGALLSHQSPYGFDEPMHGRYAWLQDSYAHVATGLARLVPLVRHVPCVYAAPGRDHEIVAAALARMLEVPVAPWPAIGTPAPGVVALYDLLELPPTELPRLLSRKPDQILYAHASPWTQDFPIAPDVTTLLYQTIVAPWGETVVVDPDTRQVSRTPADTRGIDEIANDVIASTGLDGEATAMDDLTRWGALVQKAWPPLPGQRTRWWAGGPVPSNRFE